MNSKAEHRDVAVQVVKRKERQKKFKRSCRRFNIKVLERNAAKAMEATSARKKNQMATGHMTG